MPIRLGLVDEFDDPVVVGLMDELRGGFSIQDRTGRVSRVECSEAVGTMRSVRGGTGLEAFCSALRAQTHQSSHALTKSSTLSLGQST